MEKKGIILKIKKSKLTKRESLFNKILKYLFTQIKINTK